LDELKKKKQELKQHHQRLHITIPSSII